jgi:predicted phosphodiesterase
MRFALVSDIHGNLPALLAVVADISRRGVDGIINLGDSLSGPLLVKETAQFLMASGWTHLAGNHERQLVTIAPERQNASDAYAYQQLSAREFEWIASLADTQRFSDDVFLCHGTPASDLTYFLETVDADSPNAVRAATHEEIERRRGGIQAHVIACGHTHVPHAVRMKDGTLIVNPGSVGLPAYDDDHPILHYVENGSPDARYAIIDDRDGTWHAQLIAVQYDFAPMVTLAKNNGREDWAHAIASGRALRTMI